MKKNVTTFFTAINLIISKANNKFKMKKKSWNKILIVSIFAIAMGFLEAVVVVYLRKLFYPDGFIFPLKGFIEPSILSVEWLREFATIVMLVTIGMLAGKKFYERFAYFIYAFAIWDIFYYIFLKLTLNWPSSFFTWDLLFLIPWPWVGPVIAPILYALVFIIMASLIISFEDAGIKVKINIWEWLLIIIGGLVSLSTWLYDYGRIIFSSGFAKQFFTLAENPEFYNVISNYSPSYYNWVVFLIGWGMVCTGIIIFYLRHNKNHSRFPTTF